MKREEIADWFMSLQDTICDAVAQEDGGKFVEDTWERQGGGGGRTRILQGNVIEKGGVNFSAVHGDTPENILRALNLSKTDFFATGVSIVMHPASPMVPIIHMNVRYFEMGDGNWWFGGGIDLTPHYIRKEDAGWFHRELQKVCDRHHPDYYRQFKKWADDYFFLSHRDETRGVGGIFFDRLTESRDISFTDRFNFVKDVGECFAPVYIHLIRKNRALPYGDREKAWQRLRRGRYVEFNLVWDKGTRFGLDTGGRTESILMSLPPRADWTYNDSPEPGTEEYKTLQLLKKEIDWANG